MEERTDLILLDDEFRTALPSLRPEEYAELERQLRTEGCRDPLVVWETEHGKIMVDGHNRFELCHKHKLAYSTVSLRFASRDEVLEWIWTNQRARRNFTDSQYRYALGKRYETLKRQGERTDLTSAQNEQRLETTADRLAQDEKISAATVRRALDFKKAVDVIAVASPIAKDLILAEKIQGLTHRDVVDLSKDPEVAANLFSRDHLKAGEIRQALRDANRRARHIELTRRGTPGSGERWPKFNIIYADPPWEYPDSNPLIGPQDTFPVLSNDELLRIWFETLKMPEHIAPDVVLFLWGTAPNLPAALDFMERVGFTYKTQFIWHKNRPVFGSYSTTYHEILLLGVRGSPTPEHRLNSVFTGERWSRLHSAKPNIAYEMIEQMYPAMDHRLELFARQERPGWVSWGNEVPGASASAPAAS